MTRYDQLEFDLIQQYEPATRSSIAEIFEPSRLAQARILAWMTRSEVAERIGVSAAAVGQYESGVVKPRPGLLPVLAKTLDVPLEFFAGGRPLARLDAADAHFRSLRSTRSKDRAKAAAHAEQLWELTNALEGHVRFPKVDLPEFPDGTSPQEAAHLLRRAWSLSYGPVSHLVATMESRGVVVSLIPLTNEPVTRVKAYSTRALDRPLVVVTPERIRSVYEYRFTCAHELGHLLMHPNPRPGDRQQEREADQFAAEFLTPTLEIKPLLPRSVQLAALDRLSRQWGVSIECLVYRMGELQMVSDVSIRRAHQRLASMVELRRDEPVVKYPGETPSLLREAAEVANRKGLDRAQLAHELAWTTRHLAELLGDIDTRPALRVVR